MSLQPARSTSETPTVTGDTFEAGERVWCRSLSLAGGTGTVDRCDDRLVWVRLDSGLTRPFLASAVTRVLS